MTPVPQHWEDLSPLRERLAHAQSICVLTGAGISADSGVPTFRGSDGLWRQYRPEELATPEAFARDPRTVWEWYNWRRERIAACEPNPGHQALARLEQEVPRFTLITQNVDGLHRAAGSQRILEIHGNLWWVRCTRCGQAREDRRIPLPWPPTCESCGGLLRPHVVWFGEPLDPELLQAAGEATRTAEVFLVVGTSGVVQPAASFAWKAREAGAYVVEVNTEPTPITGTAHKSLFGRAAQILPLLVGESLSG